MKDEDLIRFKVQVPNDKAENFDRRCILMGDVFIHAEVNGDFWTTFDLSVTSEEIENNIHDIVRMYEMGLI